MAEYIEREALRRKLYDADAITMIGLKLLDYFPAADVQPVKHGKWIGRELGYCTCCGHKGCASDMWNGCEDIYYCPNCGARMDGDV